MTIPSLFISSVEKNRNRLAFHYFRNRWESLTYEDILFLSNGIASKILKMNPGFQDRIAIVSENRPEWCAAYMAIVMCGCIAVPIDTQLGIDEIKNLILDSESKIVLYTLRTEENVMKAIEGLGINGINLDFVKPSQNIINIKDINPDDIASILYTSGTTGKPKGVMLSHNNLCSDALSVINSGLISRDDNILSILPLHHAYPFMCTLLVPVLLGASVTFSPGLKSSDIISSIKEKNITIVVAVPRLLDMIRNGIFIRIKDKKFAYLIFSALLKITGILRRKTDINLGRLVFGSIHKNFRSLKFFACGGARLEPSVMKDLEAIGFTIIEGYGLSETSPIITFNPLKKRKPGSAGIPLPDTQIKISNQGEIMVKGRMVMKGYYKNPSATSESIIDGWLLTGDIGYIDDEGYLFITGRKKEVIVLSSGKNVYPEDVEKLYSSIPLIKEICVMGIGDVLHAVIVPDFDYAKKALIGNIYEAIKWKIIEVSATIPEYMRIKGFTIHPEPLPRTPLGKIRRFLVAELIKTKPLEVRPKEHDTELVQSDVGRKLLEIIRSLSKQEIHVRLSDNLELDIGFDSLKRIEFISAIESAFSISLPDTFTSEVQTVKDVFERVNSLVSKGEFKEGVSASLKDILQREPSVQELKKVYFSFSTAEMLSMYLIGIVTKILIKLLFGLKVAGRENIPVRGPFIIAPNHTSYLDGFVVAASLNFRIFRNLYFLGFQKYFVGGIKSWLAKIFHVIPVDQDVYTNRALQMSAYVIRNNKAICIFPEGGRSFDGRLMEFKKGIGVIAMELNVPVIPACIKGTFEALPRGAKFIKPYKINIIFGKPLRPSDIDMNKKPVDIDKYQYFANELRKKVSELC